MLSKITGASCLYVDVPVRAYMRAAILTLLLIVTGCGASHATVATSARFASPRSTIAPTNCASSSQPSDPTTGWIPLSNKSGQFSLLYPCGWGASNCEASQIESPNAQLGPEFKGSSGSVCGHDESIPTLMVVEYPSTTPQGSQPGEYVAPITATTSVTVDAVIGVRQTA